ncbi:MAG: HAMP domain-containing sensor histidine kinase [Paenibacillus macerans]|uniref:sensor histidine kinase n=1 Tax=Paenibacillus TaxID=44249 RepID=UPI000EC7BD31|nr:HAMP domain-containing sensor histidine kinase [Paenibacillus macerans]MBS5913345.1 HAMP domain-containing histidine kinase [Paenibacillus macerans]MDU5946567.1 HAMP domain-containing sensor histidine kinase [Paenibacillus macerans]MDU7474908.1 HAMP domain-containing sensor histidine kinase [Paenibacillus macerans]MEC0137654.1 HAMP domain-containing sensor histidine kinase [Paenibacillus macerans]UMV48492.1 HAMP domain-containing histidine kinase [Paenibacillus macerans]
MAKLKFRSFRFQMIKLFGLSMLLSAGTTVLIYLALRQYYHTLLREDPMFEIRQTIRDIGDINVFLIIFFPISFFYFYLLTRRYVAYFREISRGINQLAGGDFSYRVHVPSSDELGDIARDINLAGEKLQHAVERGDFAETSKEQLVLNLAHDLRTPLTSVIGYLDFILQGKDLTAEQMKHYTSIAYTKSQRLEKLIDELFEVTRMNYGKLKLNRGPIDLGELLTQLAEELYPLFEKNELTVRLDLAPQLTISGDGDLLARVFENLLSNAVRYGKDGGYIDIHGRMEEGNAVIRVINYGDSIPPDELPHLFEMFFTGDRARTHQGGSTGLGLFIAKNIIEQHEGSISAQSDIIRTQFEVRLPKLGT